MAELPEFRKLRTLTTESRDNTILATCLLGRLLARHVTGELLRVLQAEAVRQAYIELATAGLKAADDLANTLGELHPVVAEAKGLARTAFEATDTVFQVVERPSADDPRLEHFWRTLRPMLQACITTVARVGEHNGS
jgi:hypothetical protein